MLRVIGVPIDSVGIPGDGRAGTALAPHALRDAGLIDVLGAADAGDLSVGITSRHRDESTGVLGWSEVAAMTIAVRQSVVAALHAGDLPVVIGGCCSLLPGALAGARDALGVVGLAYVDGHLDLYDGRTSPTGEAADMPIAVVTGWGPDEWVDLVGAPLAPASGTVLLGPRDRADMRERGAALPEDIGVSTEFDPATLRDIGFRRAGADSEVALTTAAESFWLHLDVDVLSSSAMPATDYLQPGGLEWAELVDLLAPLAKSESLVGFSLGCFNPEKAPAVSASELSTSERLVELLGALLR